MILHDIIDEYYSVDSYLTNFQYYFKKGNEMIHQYLSKIHNLSEDLFDDSIDANKDTITNYMYDIEKEFLTSLIDLYSSSFSISYQLGALTSSGISDESLRFVWDLRNSFERFNNISKDIIQSRMFNTNAKYVLPDIITVFQELNTNYIILCNMYSFLNRIEMQLLKPLPEEVRKNNIKNFEIRSYKNALDLSSYAQDLSLLAKFMEQAQSILNSSAPIYTRKIESGSLKITWSGGEVEISCISEIINAIINGIRTLAFIPSEIKIKQQEINELDLKNESIAIENKSKKLAIVLSQIDILSEKLGLDKNNPEDIEKIEQLCMPLIGYLENNPVGCINDQKYNIDSSVKYLILKEKEKE